jgi:4-carboxymuconolactone decarboxylase
MAISAAAKNHYDQLFGDRVSTLARSDPELIEYFDNFAFGEVYAD